MRDKARENYMEFLKEIRNREYKCSKCNWQGSGNNISLDYPSPGAPYPSEPICLECGHYLDLVD